MYARRSAEMGLTMRLTIEMTVIITQEMAVVSSAYPRQAICVVVELLLMKIRALRHVGMASILDGTSVMTAI